MVTALARTSIADCDAEAVRFFCSSHNLTHEAFYVAAWSYTLSVYTASSAVKTSLAQRSHKHAHLSVFPVSATIEGHMTILEACAAPHVNKTCSDIDLETLSRQHAHGSALHDGGSVIAFIQNDKDNFDLDGDAMGSIQVILTLGHDNQITIHYFPSSLPALSAEAFLETFTTIVNWFVISPPTTTILNNLPIVGPLNRATLETWSPAAGLSAVQRCIHDYVDEWASKTPLKEAVVGTEGLNFTYAQLALLSDRLAAYLINLGIINTTTTIKGGGGGEVVPILFDKSPVAVLAIVAIMKAGGAYVGFSAETPINFLRECSSIADVPLIITSRQHAHLVEKIGRRALILDQEFLKTLESESTDEHFRSPAQPSDLAYLVFTSGSTGVPKAVMIEHRAYVTDALAQQKAALLNADSRVLHFASYNFDATNFDILSTLIAGGTICVPTEFDRMNRLAGAINDLGANFIGVTATLAQTLDPDDVPSLNVVILCGEANNTELVQKWSSLSGPRSRTPSRTRDVVNGYGPSEASCAFSYNVYTRQSPRANNIGRALEGACWGWVVNPSNHHQLLPVGAIGELLIQGPTLSRGYLKEPEKTAKVFVEGPEWFPRKNNSTKLPERGRLYRTGDLVRQLPDQSFEVFGRVDTQVKLNGQRIELGEIENKISRVLGDKYMIAVEALRPPSPEEQGTSKVLIAFYAPTLGSASHDQKAASSPFWEDLVIIDDDQHATVAAFLVDVQDTKQRLSNDLKAIAIPQSFVPLRFMPVTTQGKLDRKFLQVIGSHLTKDKSLLGAFSGKIESQSAGGGEIVKDDNDDDDTERIVQQLFAKSLNLRSEAIFRESDFFALGGDSIRAIQLVALARKLGFSLSVPDILIHPKLSALADLVRGLKTTKGVATTTLEYRPFDSLVNQDLREEILEKAQACCLSVADNDQVQDVIRSTDLQASCVAFSTYKEERRGINWLLCDFERPQDEETVCQLCDWLTSRHQTLRTFFMAHRRTLYQVVSKSFQPPSTTHVHLKDIQDATMELMEHDLQKRDVDFTQPQTAFELLSHSDAASIERLVIRLSAAQYDGQSVAILRREMGSFLSNKYTHGDANPAPIRQVKSISISRSYSGYLHQARELEFEQGVKYWRRILAGAQMTQITRRRTPGPANQMIPSGLDFVDGVLVKMVQTRHLDLAATRQQQQATSTMEISTRSGRSSTRATMVKTAWALTLAALTGEKDVVFGSTGWGRNSPVEFAQDVMGSCTSHIPTRARLLVGNRSAAAGCYCEELMTYGELVDRLQAQHVDAMRFENIGANTIVEQCTSWPRWTRFSSLLVFQGLDIEPSSSSSSSGSSATPGSGAVVKFTEIMDPGDRTDIIVHVEPFGEHTRVMMAYAKKNIPDKVAGIMLQTFERYLEQIALRTDQVIVLDLGDGKSSQPLLPIDSTGSAHGGIDGDASEDDIEEENGNDGRDGGGGEAQIKSVAEAEALVKEVWSDVLGLGAGEEENGDGVDGEQFERFRETGQSFFQVWGNPVSAAALAHKYRKEGLAISTEDVLRNQTVQKQIRLISSML